jgi:hypothetical protein
MEEGQPPHRLTLPPGGYDEADLIPQDPRRPGFVVLETPADPAEEHHRQLRPAHQLDVGRALDEIGRILGDGQDGLDGVPVGVGAVDGQGEPQGEPPGPPGQVVGVVARVPLARGARVEHVEVGGVLGVDGLGQVRLTVDEGGTVERGEQPLVRVHHQ